MNKSERTGSDSYGYARRGILVVHVRVCNPGNMDAVHQVIAMAIISQIIYAILFLVSFFALLFGAYEFVDGSLGVALAYYTIVGICMAILHELWAKEVAYGLAVGGAFWLVFHYVNRWIEDRTIYSGGK